MYFLCLDTTTKYLAVAVAEDGCLLARYYRSRDRQHGRLLVPVIAQLLKKTKIPFGRIDCLAVTTGPGSFTGLRIGLATVKGLALAGDKPIIGLSTLDVTAWPLRQQGPYVCSLFDAKRGLVYGCLYRATERQLDRCTDYFLGPVEHILGRITSPAVFTGDALPVVREKIAARGLPADELAPERYWFPRLESLAVMSFRAFKNGQAVNAEKLTPLYLYPDTCTVTVPAKNRTC